MKKIPYSVSTDWRRTVHTGIAVAVVATYYLVDWKFKDAIGHALQPVWDHVRQLFQSFQPSSSLITLSGAFSLYAVYLWTFENLIWRLPIMRHGLGIPDLRGQWDGTRVRIKDGVEVTSHFTATIEQTWSRIQIRSDNVNTVSHATTAAFVHSETGTQFLFTYDMEANGNAPRILFGSGTQKFWVLDGERVLNGHYYSNNSRTGTEILRRRGRRKGAVTPQPSTSASARQRAP